MLPCKLLAGGWAGSIAFADVSESISSVAMMGMLGSIFHSTILFAALFFRVRERRIVALCLLAWHIPEAILIASLGMGVPADQQLVGIVMHASFGILAFFAWYLEKPKEELS